MAIQVERMVAILEARLDKYEKGLARASSQTNRQFTAIERRGKMMESRMAAVGARVGQSFASFGKGLIAAFAARATVGALKNLSDAATRIDNSLKIAGLSGEQLEKVYNRLRESAVRNAAPLEALTELYGRAALVQKDLGISGEELLNFTDKIAVALRVSGKSAAESSGALLQLSQALGAGTVRAEEFNSILEGALPIAQAAAAGLKEAGGSVARLRQLVVAGQVSSEAFFRAFEAGAPILEEKVANATFTVSQATGNLGTALIDVAREFNNSTGASEAFAGGINNAAEAIADFDVTGFISKIQDTGGALDRFLDDLGNADIFNRLNQAFGLMDENGVVINLDAKAAKDEAASLEREVKILQDTIAKNTELGFDNTGAIAQLNKVSARLAQVKADMVGMSELNDVPGYVPAGGGGSTRGKYRPPTVLDTVSLDDFAPPSGGGSKGRKRGGGGRGGRARRNELQSEIDQIKERTAAIQAETTAMAGLNPLIDDYGLALETARSKQDLLTAAKRAGIEVTPELEATIDELASGYGRASAEANKLAESQDNARRTAEELRDLGKDVMGGFISDLVNGKSAADALASALGKVADKLFEMALNNLFDGGGGGGGILGSLFGGLFGGGGGGSWAAANAGYASGTANTGGQRGKPMGIVHGQEAVIPLPFGGKVPVQIQSGGGGGGTTVIQLQLSKDLEARILQEAQGQSVEIMQGYDKQLPDRMNHINQNPRMR